MADKGEKEAGDSLASEGFLHVQGTEVWRQVFSAVEIILYDAGAGNDAVLLRDDVPLGNGGRQVQAFFHAFDIFLGRNTPFRVKPAGGLMDQLRAVGYFSDFAGIFRRLLYIHQMGSFLKTVKLYILASAGQNKGRMLMQ